jgi:hypothetical protein
MQEIHRGKGDSCERLRGSSHRLRLNATVCLPLSRLQIDPTDYRQSFSGRATWHEGPAAKPPAQPEYGGAT